MESGALLQEVRALREAVQYLGEIRFQKALMELVRHTAPEDQVEGLLKTQAARLPAPPWRLKSPEKGTKEPREEAELPEGDLGRELL